MIGNSRPTRERDRRGGFSLAESLMVIAVLGIFLAISVPVVSTVRNYARQVDSKMRYGQYLVALEAYRGEYGDYPEFLSEVRGESVNLNEDNNWMKLMGALGGGIFLENSVDQKFIQKWNPRRKKFYQFSDEEFLRDVSGMVIGLVDGFGNPNIKMIVEDEVSGYIDCSFLQKVDRKKRAKVMVPVVVYSLRADYSSGTNILSYD